MAYIGKTREPEFQFHASPTVIEQARKMRLKMTVAEKALWERVGRHQIAGLKFRRQHPIRWYVADFYCHAARLVIEVDGPVHYNKEQKAKDQQKDGVLEDLGIMVLRYSNERVLHHIGEVIKEIREIAVERAKNLGATGR